jgi:nucleotide-binding universal stress UspA family protein
LEYLSAFVRQAEAKGLKARAHAALGDAAARIIEESKNVDGALVIISSHGRGGWKRLFLGSVADKIVRASHHPVLVLKHVRE